MDKEMYLQLEDNGDLGKTVLTLDDSFEVIKSEIEGIDPAEDRQFIITPIWLTEDEFQALPEMDY